MKAILLVVVLLGGAIFILGERQKRDGDMRSASSAEAQPQGAAAASSQRAAPEPPRAAESEEQSTVVEAALPPSGPSYDRGGYRAGISAAAAASLVSSRRGRPVVVMIYRPTCGLSRALFPQMAQAASAVEWPEVMAFSSAPAEDFADFPAAGAAPFRTQAIFWEPGELTSAMATIGVVVPRTFLHPLVAVFNSQGEVVGQWQGLTSLAPIAAAVSSLDSSDRL
jgi:hypothetical protein